MPLEEKVYVAASIFGRCKIDLRDRRMTEKAFFQQVSSNARMVVPLSPDAMVEGLLNSELFLSLRTATN